MASREDIKFVSNPKIGQNRKKYCRFRRFGIKYIDYKDVDFLMNFINEQGKLLGKNLNSLVRGKKKKEYEYSNKGSMATVGRHLAVVDLPKFSFQGFFAWIFWMFLHLMLILGVKNKFIVFTNWMWKYFTFDQSLRLIIKPYNKSLK